MSVQNRNHWSGIIARYRLLKTICWGRTDALINECQVYLDKIGHVYPGVCADLEPFSFLQKVCAEGTQSLITPDFSDLAAYDFSDGLSGRLPEWTAEPEVSLFIGRLVFGMNATVAVEIGSFIGVTSAHIAKAFVCMPPNNRKLYCVDISDEFLKAVEQNMKKLGLMDYAHLITGRSLDKATVEAVPDADIIFIDSSHEYATTCAEIDVYSKKLKNGGILVLHDSIQWPGVRNALTNYSKQFQVFTFATSRGNGLSVLRRI